MTEEPGDKINNMSTFDETWKNKTIEGSHFPGKPISNNVKISFSKEMINEYIPASQEVEMTRGMRLLTTIMANKEGFYKGTRSYKNNNPGNIGNTDSGANVKLFSLGEGIKLQRDYVQKIIEGKSKTYPIGKERIIKPFYSEEIAKNAKTYGMSPWLPGYRFVFTGQLDQFVKIYSTGARAGNSYLSMIISYFKNHGIEINAQTTLKEIAAIQ